MALLTAPWQLKGGGWKAVTTSDEDPAVFMEACTCERHETAAEAMACANGYAASDDDMRLAHLQREMYRLNYEHIDDPELRHSFLSAAQNIMWLRQQRSQDT